MNYLIIFIASLLTSAVLSPIAIWLSHKTGALAVPGGRRKHVRTMPKLGGIPIFVAFLVGAWLCWQLIPPEVGSNDARLITGVL
ncbi:MAG: hypothetical protein AAGD96_19515, partial [Chloroflexota bacterium]